MSDVEPQTVAPSSSNGSEAVGSSRRPGGWLVAVLRVAVYLTAIMLAELLLEAYHLRTFVRDEE